MSISTTSDIFLIPEILEQILSWLPEKDLLLNQRVSTVWKDVIRTSPTLQYNLFFRADVFPPGEPISSDLTTIKWNPLLGSLMVAQPILPTGN